MLKKRKIGYYPFGNVVFSISITLFVLGIFCLLSIYAYTSYESLKKDLFITVFLKKNTTQKDTNILIDKIKRYEFVSSKDDSIIITKREEIAKKYFIETGDDFKNILNKNPFRDYLVIFLNKSYFDPISLERVKNKLQQYQQIFEVTYPHHSIEKISSNMKNLSFFFIVLITILLITNFVMISNVIKLAIYSQRFLIRSMQLVGAKKSYIKSPFVIRAFFHGLLSGLLAISLLFSINYIVLQYYPTLISPINITIEVLAIFGILIIFGSVITALSANFAVKKYLRYTLNDLY